MNTSTPYLDAKQGAKWTYFISVLCASAVVTFACLQGNQQLSLHRPSSTHSAALTQNTVGRVLPPHYTTTSSSLPRLAEPSGNPVAQHHIQYLAARQTTDVMQHPQNSAIHLTVLSIVVAAGAMVYSLYSRRWSASTTPLLSCATTTADEPFQFACCIIVRGQELKTVVVTGATGRTGMLVVNALLERGGDITVRALVRNQQKANEVLPKSDRLNIVVCDLGNEKKVKAACEGADAVIWCATGFSTNSTPLQTAANLFGLKVMKRSIDSIALRALGEAMKLPEGQTAAYPRVIMCSSAAVTRPIWPEEKKQRLVGAADIPIVRLNPFGVLDLKRDSEQVLRDTGVSYAIVRPTGLNAQKEAGRFIFSQGDVAVGRISRSDVAELLVRLLMEEPDCIGKTFEVLSLPGLPSPRSLQQQLSRLVPDGQALSEDLVQAQYNILQQLLPGETLQADQLAMGQTYEQLDRGETGRLGKRGEEVVPGMENFGGTTR